MFKLKGFKTFVACTVAAATIITTAIPVVAAANTGKVKASVLNLRSGKSLVSSVIEKIPSNATVTILDSSDSSWLKVSYNNKTGYVAKEYIDITASKDLGTGVVTASTLNVRKTASTNASIVGKLPKNQMVNIESKSGDWYSISAGSIKGFVKAEYIKSKSLTGKVSLSTSNTLNVRSAANLSSSKIGTLKKNASVEITSTSGDWYYVKSGSVKGYVYADYIKLDGGVSNASGSSNSSSTSNTLIKGNIFKCTASSLNVRKSPSTSAAKVAAVVKGNKVTFLAVASDKDWYQVKTSNGVTGYVKKDYVTYHSTASSSTSRSEDVPSSAAQSKADSIISTAKKYLGVRYSYGGSSPNGFDCSGFTQYVFKQNGYTINRTSTSQASNGTAVAKSNLRAGDLVFFSSSIGQSRIGHVGIYIGGGQFIHSSSGKSYKVVISSLSDAYYSKTYKAARRIIK